MKKLLSFTLSISLLLISSGLFYYFVVALPNLKQQEISIRKEAQEQDQLEKDQRAVQLSDCLQEAEDAQRKSVRDVDTVLNKSCKDSDGNILSTEVCTDFLNKNLSEIKADYATAESACHSRFK